MERNSNAVAPATLECVVRRYSRERVIYVQGNSGPGQSEWLKNLKKNCLVISSFEDLWHFDEDVHQGVYFENFMVDPKEEFFKYRKFFDVTTSKDFKVRNRNVILPGSAYRILSTTTPLVNFKYAVLAQYAGRVLQQIHQKIREDPLYQLTNSEKKEVDGAKDHVIFMLRRMFSVKVEEPLAKLPAEHVFEVPHSVWLAHHVFVLPHVVTTASGGIEVHGVDVRQDVDEMVANVLSSVDDDDTN